MDSSQKRGEKAARLKWIDGLSWSEICEHFPGHKYDAIRSAARAYRRNHPDEFSKGSRSSHNPPSIEGTKTEERQNVFFAQYGGEEKKRLADFISEMNPDPAIWEPHKPGIKKHTAWRKNEDKDLVFDEGVISGHVRSGGILAVEFWNMWCSYVRRELKPTMPLVQPVQFATTFKTPPIPKANKSIKRSLAISDAQIGFRKDQRNGKLEPFHDRLALDIICQIVASEWFDRIDIIGDWVDFTECTKHYAQEPEFHLTTQPTIWEAAFWLARLRSVSKNKNISIVYEEGNHEVRLQNYVMRHFYAAHDLRPYDDVELPILSVQRLLGLDSLGVRYIAGYPDAPAWLTPTIKVIHSQEVGDNAAKKIMENSRVSILFGHPHRKLEYWKMIQMEDEHTEPIAGVSFGHLGVLGKVPGSDERDNWHEGFGVVEYKEGLPPKIEQVSVNDGTVIWSGMLWKGKSREKELGTAFPNWNW
jgi:hypothetical protein